MVKKFFILLLITIFSIAVLLTFFSKDHSDQTKDIRLGGSLPLSGINQYLGNEIVTGAISYFRFVNQNGGINGKKIKFIYYDDKYEPEITQNNVRKLLDSDHVFALFDFVGTPTTKYILPTVIKTKIPFIAPYTGAKFLRNPNIPNIVNLRSSYEEEIDAIVAYLKDRNISRISIFYQNDEYGKEGYLAALKALHKRDLDLVSEGTYKRNTLFVSQAIHDISSPVPQAIILVGAYKPTARFIEKTRNNKILNNVLFCPISFVNADALMRELDFGGKNIIFTQTVPPYTQNNKNAIEYRTLLRRYYPGKQPSFASYESFLAAKAVTIALKRCKGSINSRAFLHALKNLPVNSLGDLKINYQNSQLLNKVYLMRYKNGIFETLKVSK